MYYEQDKAEESKTEKSADEVEDLYSLLVKVKQQFPEVQAVASGAIFSNY
jgi:diphthamide synthase (EF-2-diphthine--ammonia ligase)